MISGGSAPGATLLLVSPAMGGLIVPGMAGPRFSVPGQPDICDDPAFALPRRTPLFCNADPVLAFPMLSALFCVPPRTCAQALPLFSASTPQTITQRGDLHTIHLSFIF